MTARIVLATAAMLLAGACLYLFLEVRAKPAQAQASAGKATPTEAPPDDGDDGEVEPPAEPPQNATPRSAQVATASEASKTPVTLRTSIAAKDSDEPIDPTKIEDSAITDPDGKPGYKLDAIMAEANRHYDRMELDEAREIAQRVLKKLPTNTRMLRIMVSAACHEGDQAEAQKHFNLLPARDREQMKTRCMRNNVTFTDPPPRT